jgi:pimeloyl-ACP methyl ester carboxylesterase
MDRATSSLPALGVLMTAWVVVIAWAASIVGDQPAPFIQFGGDPSQGVLVNLSAGARPGDLPVAGRPTVVFIHGFNPLPRTVHFTMADQMAAALVQRVGPGFNVLGWNWNGATFTSLSPRANNDSAVVQGHALAARLQRLGIPGARLHLIGHSSGSIVAAAAARSFALRFGQPVTQVTLLEPAAGYHPLVFDRLSAGSYARRVENYWSPDASAYGQETPAPGVQNIRVDRVPRASPGTPLRRSSHFYVVEWYISTIADPSYPVGFNRSLLLAARR